MPNQQSAKAGTTREMTIREMMVPIFRHRKLVICVFLLSLAASAALAWGWAARYYVAKMQVLVEQDRSDPAITTAPQSTSMPAIKPLTTDEISSEVALLQGQDMLRSVADTCGMASKPSAFDVFLPKDPAQRKAAKIEGAAARLGRSLSVDAEKNSDVINVKYGKAGDPRIPACVLQTLSKLYLEKHLQLRRPPGSTDFFTQESEKYHRALNDAEARLAAFSEHAGVAAPDELRSDMAQQVAGTESLLYQAKQAVAADEQRIKNVQEQMNATPARSATQEVSNSANMLLQQLGTSLLTAENNRSQLMMKYDPSYPLVREADQEISQTQEAINKAEQTKYDNETTDRDPTYELLREDMAKTQADLAAQQASVNALEKGIRSMRGEMVSLDADALKQGALLREAKADEADYLLYLGRREQERASDALDAKRIADVAIAVPAVVPALPAYSPILVTFLGFIFSAFVGASAGYVADYLDPSFRTPEEVLDTLKIPVLASMPRRAA
jgi:polysaccharide biosynthesis transport protein